MGLRRTARVLFALLLVALAGGQHSAPSGQAVQTAAAEARASAAASTPSPVAPPSPAATAAHGIAPTIAPTRAPQPAQAPAAPPAPLPAGSVTAIGDSVMVDATPDLLAMVPGINVDAAVSRHTDQGIAELQSLSAAHRLAPILVVALGTNGTFSSANLNQILSIAEGRPLVLVTNHCPYCGWVAANNAVIHAGCTAARSCRVADWQALANTHPEWFNRDGVHLPVGGAGAQAYATMVAQAL